VGRDVAEQGSHRRCPALTPPAKRRIGEIPHYGAAGRTAAPCLGIYLGEEIVWKGDHYLCHAVSIPRYTQPRREFFSAKLLNLPVALSTTPFYGRACTQ
jgi:hypothetical protein